MLNIPEVHVANQRKVSSYQGQRSSTSTSNNAVHESSPKKHSSKDTKFNDVLQSLLLSYSAPQAPTNTTHKAVTGKYPEQIKRGGGAHPTGEIPKHSANSNTLALHQGGKAQGPSPLANGALSSTANRTLDSTNNNRVADRKGVANKGFAPNTNLAQTTSRRDSSGESVNVKNPPSPIPQTVTSSTPESQGPAPKDIGAEPTALMHATTLENVTSQSQSTQASSAHAGSSREAKTMLNSAKNEIQGTKQDRLLQTTALGKDQTPSNHITHPQHSTPTSDSTGVVGGALVSTSGVLNSSSMTGAPVPTLDIQSNNAVQSLHNFVIQQIHADTNSLSVQVNPQGMGNINILLQHQAGGAISIQVQSNNPQTVQWLQNQQGELTNALKADGFSIANMQISYGQGNGANSNGHQQSRRPNTNRTSIEGVQLDEVPFDYQSGEVSTSSQVRRWFG